MKHDALNMISKANDKVYNGTPHDPGKLVRQCHKAGKCSSLY
jgi:hypothetical protein